MPLGLLSRRSGTNSTATRGDHSPTLFAGYGSCDIAIIGFSFIFPQADSPESFWDVLISGKCVASQFPQERLRNSQRHDGGKDGIGAVLPQKASFIQKTIGSFDARFFAMTSEEAEAMDPQQRILLETTYRALENAGIPTDTIKGSDTSVHTGCFTADYALNGARDPDNLPKYAATGMAGSMLSNRISTYFDLTGPSITVDTACSSSLVALDLACQSILDGRSKMGIVAGCNLLLAPDLFVSLSNLGFLSPDGVCHSFDSRANGYGRGEGFGVLIIKPVDAAVRDGDIIRAVIRSVGTNQNGHTNLAQPNKEMQRQLIENTYRKANLDLSQTRYFEAHGTGTASGDPIEAGAIGDAFRPGRDPDDPLIVGTVKANIGHLEGAAGIAGVIKTILVLENGVIPPIAQLENINEDIDTKFLKLKFPKVPVVWPRPGLRRASVNSFGFGGTNAHVVLDDAWHYLEARGLAGRHCTTTNSSSVHDPTPGSANIPSCQNQLLFVWSAADRNATLRMVKEHQKYIERSEVGNDKFTPRDLTTLAYLLAQRRTVHSWRVFAVAASASHLVKQLSTQIEPVLSAHNRKMAFIFTGQGAQWVGMAKELFSYSVFQNSVSEADKFLQSIGCSWKASDLLLGNYGHEVNIHDPQFAQPLCTIVQIAIVDLMRSFGIHPTISVGHSSGEIAAAYTIGAICHHSALKLAYFRGLLSSELAASPLGGSRGTMMAVGLSETTLRPYLDEILSSAQDGILSIACFNSTNSLTVAGDETLIRELKSRLEQQGLFARILKVPVAYHTSHMIPISSAYRRLIGKLLEGNIPSHHMSMISSVTGDFISAAELRSPDYWVTNMVSPVRFNSAVERLHRNSMRTVAKKIDLSHRQYAKISDLVEIGPHCALQGPIRDIGMSIKPPRQDQVSYGSVLVRGKAADITLLELIGKLHCLGFDVDLRLVNGPYEVAGRLSKTFITLPEYPYDNSQFYWNESCTARNTRLPLYPYHELLGLPVADWNPLEPRWKNNLKASSIPWLEDHQINREVIYPAAAMIAMAIEAITQVSGDRTITGYELRDVHFHTALPIPPDNNGIEVQLHLKILQDPSERSSSWATFSLYSFKESFVEICRGSIKATFSTLNNLEFDEEQQQVDYKNDLIRSIASLDYTEIDSTDFYATLYKNGYHYGPSFRGIRQSIWSNTREEGVASVSMQSPDEFPIKDFAAVHPCMLDKILQMAVFGGVQNNGNKTTTWLPTYISRMWIASACSREITSTDELQVYATSHPISSRLRSSDICAMDKNKTRRLIEAENIETTLAVYNTSHHEPMNQLKVRRLCYDLVYKPALYATNRVAFEKYVEQYNSSEPSIAKFFQKLAALILTSFSQPVTGVATFYNSITEHKYEKQYNSTKYHRDSITHHESPEFLDWRDRTSDFMVDELYSGKTYARTGIILTHFSEYLLHVFNGHQYPGGLDIGHLTSMAEEIVNNQVEDTRFQSSLHRLIDTMAHKDPNMRILQTGARITSITWHIIRALELQTTEGVVHRFSCFDITDVSEENLESILSALGTLPKTRIRSFDPGQDPLSQGYEESSYDLIITVETPCTVEIKRRRLENLRRLLRQGGNILVINFTYPIFIIRNLTLRHIPALWKAKGMQELDELGVEETRWLKYLKSNEIAGFDLAFPAPYFEGNPFVTISISSNIERPKSFRELQLSQGKSIFIISGFDRYLESSLTKLIVSKLKATYSMEVRESCLHEVSTQVDSNCCLVIVVPHHHQWLKLENLNSKEYSALHTTLSRYKHILWISEADLSSGQVPAIGAVQGLARTLRMENSDHIFATVGFDTSSTTALEENLESVLWNFLYGVGSGSYEPELVQIGELLHVPRIYECDSLNNRIHELSSKPTQELKSFGRHNLCLKVRQPGLLDTLQFEEVYESNRLASDEIEIEVKAIGVNFKDCLVALGRVPDDTMGCECAGVVATAGPQSGFQQGDRVYASVIDTFRSRLRCSGMLATKIPNGMTFNEASAIPVNFVTAYHSLVVVAKLTQRESVLIHSGAGGTGQAAIQIAKICGAQVFTTVSSNKKKELLNTLYDIPTENILNSRDLSFADGIRRLTRNRGVDVVLNSLAGDALVASWECVASFGRFIEIGKKDIFSHNKLPMLPFARNVSFSAVDIAAMVREKPKLIQDSMLAISDLFNRGVLHMPSPIKSFPISKVEAAFRYLQSGTNFGKVVVEVDPDDEVLATVTHVSSWEFGQDETFVIAGGLGGQGRSISKWMVSKGARNLVLLSRTGPRDENSIRFIRTLERRGATVYTPQCDISDATSLSAVLDYCKLHMPPIKGCIQAAMDIKDSIFENMSYESWTASLKPKIHGSWNLHQLLPRDLYFFIMFSSISGIIGSQGQSNYATGNTFQDELAKYRLSRGERAVSLDLGILSSDGYLAENQDFLVRFAKIKQMLPIDEAEVLALLEHFCDKSLPPDPTRSQVVLGLDLPQNIKGRGLEPSRWTYEPMFANLHQMTSRTPISNDVDTAVDKGPKLAEQVAASRSLNEAAGILANGLALRLGTVFSLPSESFDLNQPLHNYGVDSLIAVELKNWFLQTLKVDLAIFEILGGATAMTLGRAAAEKMRSWT
ncbi:putative polyketide synthase [Daldinia caldariorum]|uniref:putative polyketide synthase n=1 Tax=Daldinia caldariorum TaxID=326644 RepID=UPI0020075C1C|nr:putative polyketide synthase [Daldinia caldariorum]KAI1464031.1 putative polyketide synthase [Daldinia caldariorum]